MIEKRWLKMKKDPVFRVSVVLVLTFGLMGFLRPIQLGKITSLHSGMYNLGWFYQLAAFLPWLLSLLLGVWQYSFRWTTISRNMATLLGLACFCRVGIGLVFGELQPSPIMLIHLNTYLQIRSTFAMRYSFFHWGFQPWAIYIVVSLSLAYFIFPVVSPVAFLFLPHFRR